MKSSVKILAAAVFTAAAVSLTSCSAPNGYSYSNIGITITAACSDCPTGIHYNPAYPQPPASGSALYQAVGGGQNGTYALTATVTNAPPSSVTWSIYPTPNLTTPNPPPTSGSGSPGTSGSAVGTFSTPNGDNNTTAVGPVAYYSNGGVPVYSGTALQQAEALGIPQGDVLIVASVPNDPNNPTSTVSVSQLIQVYNTGSPSVFLSPAEPTSPAGLTSNVVTVSSNNTFQFYGGAAGEQPCLTSTACGSNPTYTADNGVIWEVGASPQTATADCNTPGVGTCPYGWISSTGLYTAPPVVPSGGQAAVVVASHFLTTSTRFAYVGIN